MARLGRATHLAVKGARHVWLKGLSFFLGSVEKVVEESVNARLLGSPWLPSR